MPATSGTARVAGFDVFSQADEVRRQLPQLSSAQVVAEPRGRDNAPCIGLAALRTGLFADPGVRCALGVPFSVSPKNLFFDRR